MKLLFIDMDNTINDIFVGFYNYLNEELDVDIPYNIKHEEKLSFKFSYYMKKDFKGLYTVGEEDFYIDEALTSSQFFYKLPILPNVINELYKLNKLKDIYILTKPVYNYPCSILDKMDFIDKYLPFIGCKKTICVPNKYLFTERSVLIDDDHRNLQSFRGHVIRMDYPYNRKYDYPKSIGTLYNWEDGCNNIMTMIENQPKWNPRLRVKLSQVQ
jgi:5'(3')-deoxyribonucleotidase